MSSENLKNKIKQIFEAEFKPHMMFDPEQKSPPKKTEKEEDHEELSDDGWVHIDPKDLEEILKDEGGASGIDPFLDELGEDREEEIRDVLDKMPNVGEHEDGDYILDDGKEVLIKIVKEEIKLFLEKRKKSKKKKSKKKKSKGKKDPCYYKVKSRYRVWPSAYGSGALVKCRNVGASNWGNSSKKKK
tara:strand:- start:519 stop:1079 length:561 start_codon:yes stop_codon:yes gene_type:complete